MSFLNLPWKWDTGETGKAPIGFSIKRWRRGPVTFYRYVHHIGNDTETWYSICLANDLSFAIHFPARWGLGFKENEELTSGDEK